MDTEVLYTLSIVMLFCELSSTRSSAPFNMATSMLPASVQRAQITTELEVTSPDIVYTSSGEGAVKLGFACPAWTEDAQQAHQEYELITAEKSKQLSGCMPADAMLL